MPRVNDVAPVLPIYVVLPHADTRASGFASALTPLVAAAARARPLGAELFFSHAKATALVALSFEVRTLTTEMLAELASAAARCGAAVVDAARLPERARHRFHEEYLPLFDVRRTDLPSFE